MPYTETDHIKHLEGLVAVLQAKLADLRSAPTLGYAATIPTGQRMLFLDRPRAEQACVQYHGIMVELIGRPVV